MRLGRSSRITAHALTFLAGVGAAVAVVTFPAGDATVRVSAELADSLVAEHERRLGRVLDAPERRAVVDRWVDDEILFREGMARGLDRGDPVVRRRTIEMMRLILSSPAADAAPGDAALAALLEREPQRYALPQRTTLEHVFTNKAPPPEEAGALIAGGGLPFVHGPRLAGKTRAQLSTIFGADAARLMMTLPEGEWSDPVRSPYGWHLVRVESHEPARTPRLEEVRDRLRADWLAEERERRLADARSSLRQRYRVEVPAAPDVVRASR